MEDLSEQDQLLVLAVVEGMEALKNQGSPEALELLITTLIEVIDEYYPIYVTGHRIP